jgi:MMP 1-O-methyltransferase
VLVSAILVQRIPFLKLPSDFESVIGRAWQQARYVPGFLSEAEFRALGLLAICAPPGGVIVEIGSFKGKSTLALASLAARYDLGPVVSIDPHPSPSVTDPDLSGQTTSFDDFLSNLRTAGMERQVEIHRTFSQNVGADWTRPIRTLWIDGDHTYAGAKWDFDLFSPHLIEGAIIALHDTLHEYDGPIRVFVEDILRSDQFGPAAFLGSIGWAQFRPRDGQQFRSERAWLASRAERLIPFALGGRKVKGLAKLRYKLRRWRIPHAAQPSASMASKISLPNPE